VVQDVAGSNPVSHPIYYPHANTRTSVPQVVFREGFDLSEGEATIEFSPPEMLEYLRYVKKVAHLRPRTYWLEFPFFIIINGAKQRFSFGYRPQDLGNH
jgi:hypothetical protein